MQKKYNLLVIALICLAMTSSLTGFVAGSICREFPAAATLVELLGVALPLIAFIAVTSYYGWLGNEPTGTVASPKLAVHEADVREETSQRLVANR